MARKPLVMWTDHGDGSADFTVAVDEDEDHKFSVSVSGDEAEVEYEETLSWRGVVRVKEPAEEVYRTLIQSEEMTRFLEAYDVSSVGRRSV